MLSDQCKLTRYQLVGFNWLWLLHQGNLNGILADESMRLCFFFFCFSLPLYLICSGTWEDSSNDCDLCNAEREEIRFGSAFGGRSFVQYAFVLSVFCCVCC
jgi:hypothetical protein